MESHFDDLDRQHLVEIHRKVELLVKMVARQQNQIAKLLKRSDLVGKAYLRRLLQKQREQITQQRSYIRDLENELRLHGLE